MCGHYLKPRSSSPSSYIRTAVPLCQTSAETTLSINERVVAIKLEQIEQYHGERAAKQPHFRAASFSKNSVECCYPVDNETVSENLSKFVNVVWNGWEVLHVDLACIPSSIEFHIFEILSHSVHCSLIRYPNFLNEYSQINITLEVCLAPCDAAVQYEPEQN